MACIRTTILGLDSDIRGRFGALSVVLDGAFFAKKVNNFELSTILQSVSYYMIGGVLNLPLHIVIYSFFLVIYYCYYCCIYTL